MRLDFLIPASPTPSFFSQIAFFRMCLNALGGAYAQARVVATFGDHDTEELPVGWARYLDDVDVEWSHPPGAFNDMHRAQHDRRFEVFRRDADVVFLCDADIAVLRPFEGLISDLKTTPAMAGVIAHYPFLLDPSRPVPVNQRDPKGDWDALSQRYLGKGIACPYPFMLTDPSLDLRTPFYINFGMLAAPPDVLADFHRHDLTIRDRLTADVGGWWGPQISLALSVADMGLPVRPLPMRYNFPNDPAADARYPEELENVVFLHYLRTKNLRRDRIFADASEFETFMNGRFKGSDEVFRAFAQQLTGGRYPFPLA